MYDDDESLDVKGSVQEHHLEPSRLAIGDGKDPIGPSRPELNPPRLFFFQFGGCFSFTSIITTTKKSNKL